MRRSFANINNLDVQHMSDLSKCHKEVWILVEKEKNKSSPKKRKCDNVISLTSGDVWRFRGISKGHHEGEKYIPLMKGIYNIPGIQ